MTILVTGGAGYIGSHTLVALIEAGHNVIVVDNLSNSSIESQKRVEQITGTPVRFFKQDIRDKALLSELFANNNIDAVIHFAGLKAVGESVREPLRYYENNIDSTLTLLDVMAIHGVHKLVFSSSATVYGSAPVPYSESSQTGVGITNPYGRTKYMIEEILSDQTKADTQLQVTTLRYFNPIGAHESGHIGEDPSGIPNNLMPYIAQVAVGRRDKLTVFGNDYDTIDGTGVRDYIHVSDLAKGHVAALEKSTPGYSVYNLGTGKGTSVLELVRAFENASGKTIPLEFAPRRDGDLATSYAEVSLAKEALGWEAEKSIEDACRDSWHWQSENPDGYR